MVMNDCAADPASREVRGVRGPVAQLEQQCLIPLDEEGTEGERLLT